MKQITDLDLAPIYRTQANYYKAQDFQARAELRKANKGLRRLRRRLDKPVSEAIPKYAYKTIEECESIVGVKVNEGFRIGWHMARTTIENLEQLAINSGGVMIHDGDGTDEN